MCCCIFFFAGWDIYSRQQTAAVLLYVMVDFLSDQVPEPLLSSLFLYAVRPTTYPNFSSILLFYVRMEAFTSFNKHK